MSLKAGLVSIITPCYNGSKYIKETIESVLAQTYKDWEMFVIDDGSKDDSLEIMKKLAEKDSRVKYVGFSRNFGKEAGMYAGLEAA